MLSFSFLFWNEPLLKKIAVPGNFETLGLGWRLTFSAPQHSQHLFPSSAWLCIYLPCLALVDRFAYWPLSGGPFFGTGQWGWWVERFLNPG